MGLHGQELPTQAGSARIKAVAAGWGYSMALTEDGSVITWSVTYAEHECTNVLNSVPSAAQSNVVAISGGWMHALALSSSGSVIAWGCEDTSISPDYFGQIDVPQEAKSNVIAIAAGNGFSLALLSTGAVVAWGRNDNNLTQVPEEARSNVIAIAAGSGHAVALLSNGTVVTWGDNSTGQLVVPDEVQGRVMAIAAHSTGTLVITQPAPPPPLVAPSPAPPLPLIAATPPTATGTSETIDQQSASHNSGKLAGIIASVSSAALIVAAAAALYTCQRRNQAKTDNKPAHDIAIGIDGLTPGEIFTRTTAHEYRWCDSVTVENAMPLTATAENAAVQLSKEQVQQQILLVKDGLLGRGATALVFKCLWCNRFGNNALLAAKVLKDGYELDIPTLQSFYYEATVLASLNPPHANVVRLYGYCLEPPTVCLILELLPGSLKCMLYRTPSMDQAGQSSSGVLRKTLPSPHRTNSTFMTSSSSESMTSTDPSCTTYITIHEPTATATSTKDINVELLADVMPVVPQQLSMLQVLQISLDIAAGLKYLHDMPLVAAAAAAQTNEKCTLLSTVEEADTSSSNQQSSSSSEAVTSPIEVSQKTTKVVHRDLKPANILIAEDGTAKISDFGLARQQMKTTMVTEHLGAGTLPYMAPELLVSVRVGTAAMPATNRVDIYSMAMIMWEMLAGRTPWSHLNEPSMLAAVMSGRRPELPLDTSANPPLSVPLSELPASLHAMPEFNMIIRACWNQREHRRPTAAALYDMLFALLQKYQHDDVRCAP